MRTRSFSALVAALALIALAGFGWGISEHRNRAARSAGTHRLSQLEAENERLRGVVAGQEKERAVTAIRGLAFIEPVTYDVLTRAAIKQTIARKLDEQFSPAELRNVGQGLSALGLLPHNYPLKEKYIELLGEQVAAFYDQHQHRLFMFEDASLAGSQNRVVLAHELTHALQDQHVGLLKLPLEIKTNDDRALAASALVEGEATLVMSQYMLQNISLAGLRENLGAAVSQNMRQLQEAPRYLRELLVFPYLRGQEFCAALFARGGYEAISAAYKNPPSSTAQILHPDKYFGENREEPITIDFGDTRVNGEQPLADNVLGEFGTRVLLSHWIDAKKAEAAASGWRGDRYLVFNNGDAVVWKSAWKDAEGFYAAIRMALEERYKTLFALDQNGWLSTKIPRALRLLRHGENVVVIDAGDEKWAQALADKFAN